MLLPKGIKIGEINNDYTGVTLAICEAGALGGVSVLGGAPGTRETDLLKSDKANEELHAIALLGGSAFGLEACSGIMLELKELGLGVSVLNKKVPIVSGAVIFDLIHDDYYYPDKDMGRQAVKEVLKGKNIITQQGGAGKSATVCKLNGMSGVKKGGQAVVGLKMNGYIISAMFVVNALGEIFDHKTGEVILSADKSDYNPIMGANTTIGVIMTDAPLNKEQTNELAFASHEGLRMTIKPVHTSFDGDTIFVMCTNKQKNGEGLKKEEFEKLKMTAIEATALAIEESVCRK